MANFFIRRPIVAIVIAIIIVLLGLNTLRGLSFEQYPFLAPPTIRVTANYPGASAVAVEQSVATPIEQEVNGVEGMIYMKSSNTSDGRMLLDRGAHPVDAETFGHWLAYAFALGLGPVWWSAGKRAQLAAPVWFGGSRSRSTPLAALEVHLVGAGAISSQSSSSKAGVVGG